MGKKVGDLKVREILATCYTDAQVLAVIQMRLTLYSNDEVDIIIFDHFKSSKMIYDNLSKQKTFRKVIFLKSNENDYGQSYFRDIIDVLRFRFINKEKYLFSLGLSEKYDEVVFHNFTYFVYMIFDHYSRRIPQVRFNCIEEGILSYNQGLNIGKRVKILNSFNGKKNNIFDKIERYYCFYPFFKKKKFEKEIVEIPPIKKNLDEFLSIINQIYEYKSIDIKEKYIFFGNSMCIDGTCDQEPNVIKKVADRIGKENVIVKIHPRERMDIYQDIGIKVMENADLPWEIYYLNCNFESQVFLSTVSNAFLNAFMLKEKNAKGVFLFPLIEGNEYIRQRGIEIKEMLASMHKAGIMQNCVIGNLEDL